jgi:predicted dehydrogenase
VSGIGAGVIGLGVGERHAHAFARLSAADPVALCDKDPEKLAAVGRLFPKARQYARAEDLIDDPAIRVVSVASYDQDHHGQIVRALKAGKHVFAEKPLCQSQDELDSICQAWRDGRGKVRLSTNTILRRSPRFVWLREAIARGEMGQVYCVEADYVYGRLQKLTDGWRGRIPGYSVMLGGGIHMVDLVLWLTGESPVEVTAFGSGLASRDTKFQGNDLAVALLRFESGLLAKIGANFASVHPHHHRLFVYGTEASFANPAEDLTGPAMLWKSRDPQAPPLPVHEAYPGVDKGDLLPAFLEAIQGRGEPGVNEREVFAAMATCLAIDASIHAGGAPTRIRYPLVGQKDVISYAS